MRPRPIAPPEQTDEAYDDFGPSAEEIAASISETEADLNAMRKVFEADDRLAAAMAEIRRLNECIRVLDSRVNGLMEEKNAAVRVAKSWQRKAQAQQPAGATAW